MGRKTLELDKKIKESKRKLWRSNKKL